MTYTQKEIKRGLISCGSEKGKQYGLTSERFTLIERAGIEKIELEGTSYKF